MVITSTCARIGVPTCCEHVPHTILATVKSAQVMPEDTILPRVGSGQPVREPKCEHSSIMV